MNLLTSGAQVGTNMREYIGTTRRFPFFAPYKVLHPNQCIQ